MAQEISSSGQYDSNRSESRIHREKMDRMRLPKLRAVQPSPMLGGKPRELAGSSRRDKSSRPTMKPVSRNTLNNTTRHRGRTPIHITHDAESTKHSSIINKLDLPASIQTPGGSSIIQNHHIKTRNSSRNPDFNMTTYSNQFRNNFDRVANKTQDFGVVVRPMVRPINCDLRSLVSGLNKQSPVNEERDVTTAKNSHNVNSPHRAPSHAELSPVSFRGSKSHLETDRIIDDETPMSIKENSIQVLSAKRDAETDRP